MRAWAISCTVLFAAAPVLAQRVVSEWRVLDTNKWFYNDTLNAIHITDSDPNVFSFETYDATTGAPLDFDLLICDTSDPVRVRIAADPASARVYGADDVHEIDLSASSDGEIHDLLISGNLSLFGPTLATRIFGAFTVEGTAFDPILVDEAAGDITLGAMLGGLEAGSLGSLTITDADTHGYVEVSAPFSGVIDITGSLGYIWLGNDLQGELTISDDLQSMILVGDLLAPGFSDIGLRLVGPSGFAAKTGEYRARSGILGSACLG